MHGSLSRRFWTAGACVLILMLGAGPAIASPIAWQYDLLVHGTAVGLAPNFDPNDPSTFPQQIIVASGTPMIVSVFFDTDTPNVCGANPLSGVYVIGFGNTNSVSVDFMGYRYPASGGIEINSVFGSCGGSGTGLRLFVSSGVQTAPNGTGIQWSGMFGNLFLQIPPTDWLDGAYPSGLPPHDTPSGGAGFIPGSSPNLVIESNQLRPVPEPATGLLIGVGLLASVLRRACGY